LGTPNGAGYCPPLLLGNKGVEVETVLLPLPSLQKELKEAVLGYLKGDSNGMALIRSYPLR